MKEENPQKILKKITETHAEVMDTLQDIIRNQNEIQNTRSK